MIIRFWGTRGSLPTPLKPQEVEEKICRAIQGLPAIDTQDADAVRAYVSGLDPLVRGTAGGNTPCVEIRAAGEILIMDAGSGLRELGLELMKGPCGEGQGTVHLFISHLHWDHIQGFPLFRPAFIPGNRLFIYGVHDLQSALEMQQRSPLWPVTLSYMAADKTFVPLQPGEPFHVGKMRVNTIQTCHPGDSYAYRFEDGHSVFVYACDAEYRDLDEASVQPYVEFFRNADALIFDSQYTLREAWQKVDWGHSSAMIGLDLARAARVKKLVLFHHEPTYTDADLQHSQETVMAYQAQDTSRPICEVLVAHEGLTLDLTPLGAVDLQFTTDGEAAILTPVHTFDKHGVDQLARQWLRLGEQASSSIIDLSQVETLTTAGLQSLVALRQEQDVPIVLAAPSESIQQVIRLSGCQDYFAVYPSVETALAAVHAREALNLPGQVVKGRYQIEKKLGQGRLGTVLKATDLETGQPVALKIFSSAFSQNTLDRFSRQARQLIALNHPNVVKVLAWDQDGVKVEEYVADQSLQQLLSAEGAQLSSDQAMAIALDISRALEYAHSCGVIHGDLKPQNIFLAEGGTKLSGFGLGYLDQGRNLLDAPWLLLTAAYLSPEQILGQPLDARTDLYALGVILYQLFTGRLPFEGSDQEVMRAHLHQKPHPPREWNPLVSPSLEHLILKLLAKNPNERYASAHQTLRVSSGLTVRGEETTPQSQALLVGREKELETLRAYWKEASAGRGQLVIITGEPGIGKTTLAQQAAARSRAAVQLIAHCQERDVNPAYHLFSQILRSYFATVPPEFLDEQASRLCANLVRLVPEIHQMLPDLPELTPLQPDQEQLRLMSSTTEFIKQATQERPWLLILDDLQWADSSSLELLRHLGRHLPTMALLILGAYRDTELERGHPLLESLRDLGSHPGYRLLALGRLDHQDVGQLLFNLWQQPAPAALTQLIHQHTGGNPFYIEEVAKGLEDDGLVTLKEGRRQFPAISEVRLPQTIREAVWRRIDHLSSETQTLLTQAAVLGQTFRFDALQQMSGLSAWQVLEHLDAALERQLIQELTGDTMLRFRHTEIQHVLYADLGPLRRRMLHRQAGEILERLAEPEPERLAEDLAYHFREAGEYERAAVYSLAAARQSQATYANETALLWYRRTLEMLDQLGPEQAASSQLTRLLVHQYLGEVLTLVGRYDAAMQHCDLARSLIHATILTDEQSRQLAALCYQAAQVCEKRGEYDLALAWLEKGVNYLDENEPNLELVRLYNLSGWVRRHQGLYEIAQAWIERALALARAADLREEEADSLRKLGAIAYYEGDYPSYQAYSEQALQICREIADRRGEAAVLNNLGIYFAGQGEYARAVSCQEQALAIWREIGDRHAESVSLSNLGGITIYRGNYNQARAFYEQSLHICHEIGDRRGEGRALDSLGLVSASQGDYAGATLCLEQALRTRRDIGDLRGEGETINNLGIVLTHLGDYAGAKTHYEQALLIHREIGDRLGEIIGLSSLGLLLHYEGDHQAARDYCRQALELAEEVGDHQLQGEALSRLGHALCGLGQLDEAAASFERAVSTWRRLSRQNLATESLASLAHVRLLQGDTAQALSYVEEILAYLESSPQPADSGHPLDGMDHPLRIYLTCYEVLRKNEDRRAHEILKKAHRVLQERAANISEQETRRTYLEDVAVHRQIVQALAESA